MQKNPTSHKTKRSRGDFGKELSTENISFSDHPTQDCDQRGAGTKPWYLKAWRLGCRVPPPDKIPT
ncbi:hypothetical protein DSO57_1011007 [Entomophthora muscae]|uniref:Uncharacterized protein n=1 Tax=Entomophthora muscae TaxID=34485 RepID=A0ACC2RL58_9FUNG|nr:hypothetical protein DSO57_1011007 [Entomophthora muscae]